MIKLKIKKLESPFKSSSKLPLKIPFDKEGNQLLYANNFFHHDATWLDSFRFYDRLKIYRIDSQKRKTRMPVILHLVSLRNGRTYHLFLEEFARILKKKKDLVIQNATIEGVWTFQKHHRSFGLRFLQVLQLSTPSLHLPITSGRK